MLGTYFFVLRLLASEVHLFGFRSYLLASEVDLSGFHFGPCGFSYIPRLTKHVFKLLCEPPVLCSHGICAQPTCRASEIACWGCRGLCHVSQAQGDRPRCKGCDRTRVGYKATGSAFWWVGSSCLLNWSICLVLHNPLLRSVASPLYFMSEGAKGAMISYM